MQVNLMLVFERVFLVVVYRCARWRLCHGFGYYLMQNPQGKKGYMVWVFLRTETLFERFFSLSGQVTR